MSLAIFDLDDTLVDGDSSSMFLQYLVDAGLAAADMLAREAAMMADYRAGQLGMEDYMLFTMQPLQGKSVQEVATWTADYIQQRILPRLFPQALAALADYRAVGRRIVIISATGDHIVQPIARALGVDDALAIQLETREGCYTGRTRGTLTYQHGKVSRLHDWLAEQGETLANSHGYSDSINDVPLLEAVSQAHVVNPDARLAAVAAERHWPQLAWAR
ncbi:HAD family hydrolase [Paludibacterium sp. THUN1379]|uniref:HAD family hydrolase n=1 Tax=Paludibacterium sp. THUN1379 TaxID=3112107 RepID=UPI00308F0083|nr:HAD family hydrolase [Paludibacterium sp. THUN1379]